MITSFGIAVLAGLLGIAFLLVGYRFFMALLPILGFFAGFWLGATATTWILGTGFLANVTGWVVALVVGLIAAVVSYLFYLVGVAIIAAAIGAALGSGVMTALGFQPGFLVTLVAIISALVAAGLTLLLNIQKYVIILLTSAAGASFLVVGVLLLLGQITPADLQGGGQPGGADLRELVFLVARLVGCSCGGYCLPGPNQPVLPVPTGPAHRGRRGGRGSRGSRGRRGRNGRSAGIVALV
ncbi:DUF4203 domain-containing protein [Chloroflexota bacterium]